MPSVLLVRKTMSDAPMVLCVQLEASLTTATRSRLLDALLHEALDEAAA